MHFAENQLSPSLIGLSPLTTGHPLRFQPKWVRASTESYLRFTLPMARSLGFGSNPCNSSALFRLAFATPTPNGLSLLQRLTRWPIIQKVRGHRLSKAEPVLLMSATPCRGGAGLATGSAPALAPIGAEARLDKTT